MLTPIDPQKSGDNLIGWFASHGPAIIACFILVAITGAIIKALPKWAILSIGGLVALIAIAWAAKK